MHGNLIPAAGKGKGKSKHKNKERNDGCLLSTGAICLLSCRRQSSQPIHPQFFRAKVMRDSKIKAKTPRIPARSFFKLVELRINGCHSSLLEQLFGAGFGCYQEVEPPKIDQHDFSGRNQLSGCSPCLDTSTKPVNQLVMVCRCARSEKHQNCHGCKLQSMAPPGAWDLSALRHETVEIVGAAENQG